jgi:hypothetical protein
MNGFVTANEMPNFGMTNNLKYLLTYDDLSQGNQMNIRSCQNNEIVTIALKNELFVLGN